MRTSRCREKAVPGTDPILSILLISLALAALATGDCVMADAAAAERSSSSESTLGRAIFEQHCAACHGLNGDGSGPAAVWLFPKPRNFSAGLFKIQSTPAGSLPSDDDLYRVISFGMPGSSMPSFTYLSEEERREVVKHVKYLTSDVDSEGKRFNRFEAAQSSGDLRPPVEVPPEPPVTIESLAQGKEMFVKLQCATCHGEAGAGDGPSAATLKDTWGMPLLPRDFNTGAFRGGAAGRDLYLRIHNGMAGTPMPPFGEGVITANERWAVVHYIQSLRRKDIEVNDMLAPTDGTIPVERVAKIPNDPMDEMWERMDTVRVPLNPLWPEPDPIPAVAVRAVHDGVQIAVLCQWRDTIANGAPIRVQDFQDAIALQFALNGKPPFLGMGDGKNPVNIWQWKAGWQMEGGQALPDMESVYASMHTDVQLQTNVLYRTAEAAGNLLARRIQSSPVEDAVARGFGTLESQPLAGQNVNGKGAWRDGHWNVIFVRELKSNDREDVKLAAGKSAPVAFAVWDGANRDRNGRKVISNWFQFVLAP